jgi:hypothetical protein
MRSDVERLVSSDLTEELLDRVGTRRELLAATVGSSALSILGGCLSGGDGGPEPTEEPRADAGTDDPSRRSTVASDEVSIQTHAHGSIAPIVFRSAQAPIKYADGDLFEDRFRTRDSRSSGEGRYK